MTSTAQADSGGIYEFVTQKVHLLYTAISSNNPTAKAQLSNLRKAAGKNPAHNPLAWQYVISDQEQARFPERLRGRGDQPSASENAIYLALTLYAVHQQAEQKMMHQPQTSFGYAVGQLVAQRTPSIKKRFDAMLQARTFTALTYHARNLIQLLKQEAIGFNYGKFAQDLALLQHPQYKTKIITRWSRDFVIGYQSHRTPSN